jgi:hypothetical protein
MQWLAAYLGNYRREAADVSEREDLNDILGVTMSLLALIIGFTFAMAISRYDERDDLEGAETTAIIAEYERADPFFLIADIDSPRAGLIRVVPVNLIAHAQSMGPKQ